MSNGEWGFLPFLYRTVPGRALLKLLSARWLSRAAGAFCDSALSKPLIPGFIRNNGIDLSEYRQTEFSCFNDCFTREIREELRPVSMEADALVSPCDGLLSAYRIRKGAVFPVKQVSYTVASLLQNEALAEEFEGGVLLVFRLCVHHYHRYCYVDSGSKGENIFIAGRLHTVRPIALENRAVFIENCREYTVMETEHFGKLIQCEVGAMLVGRIQNHDGACTFRKGQEKGMFEYGGSTIIVLLKKNAAQIQKRFFRDAKNDVEIPVKYGEKIGKAGFV